MAYRKYTTPEEQKLDEALAALRSSPAFQHLDRRLREMLEDTKDVLVQNQTSQVPILQGRARQLVDIIDLINRKPK